MPCPARGRAWMLLGFGGGLAAVLVAAALWQGLVRPAPAYGQIPDAGAQRRQMIEELVALNRKMAEANELLREIRDLARQKPAKP
mgnify:CR=1 FL=1